MKLLSVLALLSVGLSLYFSFTSYALGLPGALAILALVLGSAGLYLASARSASLQFPAVVLLVVMVLDGLVAWKLFEIRQSRSATPEQIEAELEAPVDDFFEQMKTQKESTP